MDDPKEFELASHSAQGNLDASQSCQNPHYSTPNGVLEMLKRRTLNGLPQTVGLGMPPYRRHKLPSKS
jgi:hypothetical protein